MSKKAPPLIPGADTSSTNPSQKIPPLNSVLKLFRKVIMGDVLVMATFNLSRTLSLIPSWSAIKASLGGLSGVVVEVTHMVPSPGSGFDATQPAGSAGAVTPSKFSTHGPVGVGLVDGVGVGGGGVPPPGVDVAVAVGVAVPLGVAEGTGGPLPRSYTSTRPFPVPLFTPASSAVY